MEEKSKVPEYTRKAIDRYHGKFDRIVISLPLGSKDRIKETGKSFNQFFNDLYSEWEKNTGK